MAKYDDVRIRFLGVGVPDFRKALSTASPIDEWFVWIIQS